MKQLSNFNFYELPWRHVIIDDFLLPIHYKELLDIVRGLDVSNSEILTLSSREDQLLDELTFIPPDLFAQFVQVYVPTALHVLTQLAPAKTKFFEQAQFQVAITGPEASYRVHEDAVCKLLSGVIYLDPTESSGTFLHRKKGDSLGHEVVWKPNRAIFFSRKSNISWHSYRGDGKTRRITLVFNLIANDLNREQILRTEFSSYPSYMLDRFLRYRAARLNNSLSD